MRDWRGFFVGILILAICVALVGYTLYEAWLGLTGQAAAQEANARARAAEADAMRLREAAELAEAEAAVAEARGSADAQRREAAAAARVIEAGARTINRQSFVAMLYGILAPGGVVLALLLALVTGLSVGALGMSASVLLARTGSAKDTGEFVRAYLRKSYRGTYHNRENKQ